MGEQEATPLRFLIIEPRRDSYWFPRLYKLYSEPQHTTQDLGLSLHTPRLLTCPEQALGVISTLRRAVSHK